MAGILSDGLVAEAFALVRPAILATMDNGVGHRVLAVVVAATREINPWSDVGETGFRDACYLVTSIGDLSNAKYPNLEIAPKKAELSARTGMPTAMLPPQYMLAGDTIFWGSAVFTLDCGRDPSVRQKRTTAP